MLPSPASKLFALVLSLLVGGGLLAATRPSPPTQYSYVSVVQIDDNLYVTQGPTFEEVSVKGKKHKSSLHFAPLFDKVNEFEAQGYEVLHNTVYSTGDNFSPRNYVLLRKSK